MNEHEPSILKQARELDDSLPDDFSVYDPVNDGIISMPESLFRSRETNLSPLANMAFPVYLFMLRESPTKIWTMDKIYQEFNEKNPDKDRKEMVFRGAIALLVLDLDQRNLLEFAGEDRSLSSENTEFCLKSEYESQAKAYEYCAKLAKSAGAPKEVVQGYLNDANLLRQKSEY